MTKQKAIIEVDVSEEILRAAKERYPDLEDKVGRFIKSMVDMGAGTLSSSTRGESRGRSASHSFSSTSTSSISSFGSSSSTTVTSGISSTKSSSK